MPDVIQYDPLDPLVTNRVIDRQKSAGNIDEWNAKPNIVWEPDGFTLEPGHYKWDGVAMVPCTPTEVSNIEATEAAQNLAIKKQSLKDRIQSNDNDIFHVLHAMVDELFTELDAIGTTTRTKNAIKADILANAEARIDAITD